MPRRKVNLPSFNAVGAGQTATVDLPTDRRYHMLFINYKTNANQATIESDIEEIRIKVDGKVQRRYSAAQINILNELNGYTFKAGYIPIFFSEPWRRNASGEDFLSWGMKNVGTFQVEVVISSGATAPTLGGFAVVDNAQVPLDNIIKIRSQVLPVSSTGIVTMSTLPKRDIYQRIHFLENTAADILDIEITIDSLEVFKMNDAENAALLETRDFTPAAAAFHVLFDETQRVEDGLPMVKPDGTPISEFRIDVNMATTNDPTMLLETRGAPD